MSQSELDILREKNNASQLALEEARARIVTIEESRAVKEQELKDSRKEVVTLNKQGRKVQAELDKLSRRESQLRISVSGARQKADEAKASLAATQTQGNVLTGLMRLKESGRIEGFHVGHTPEFLCFGPKYLARAVWGILGPSMRGTMLLSPQLALNSTTWLWIPLRQVNNVSITSARTTLGGLILSASTNLPLAA